MRRGSGDTTAAQAESKASRRDLEFNRPAKRTGKAALTPKSSLDASGFSILKQWQDQAAGGLNNVRPEAVRKPAPAARAPAAEDIEEGYDDEGFEEYSDEFEGELSTMQSAMTLPEPAMQLIADLVTRLTRFQ